MRTRNSVILLLLVAFVLGACAPAQPATEEPTEAPAIVATEVPAEQPTEPAEVQPEETEAPAEMETISLRMNASPFMSYAPLFIAEAEGYFAEQGIEMEFIPMAGTSEALPAFMAGDLDVLGASVNSGVLNVLSQDDSIKVVADRGSITQDDQCTYMGIMVAQDLYESGEVTGPEDLAGRTVSVRASSNTGYLVDSYLAQAGLSLDDVEVNPIPETAYIDAFQTGALAAIVTSEPSLSRTINSGEAALLASAEDVIGTFQSSVLLFGPKLLVDDREASIRFMTAYLKGVRQYAEGKTERNLEILSEMTTETQETLNESCWPSINTNGAIDFPSTDNFQQWLIGHGYLDNAVTEEQFWDPSIVQAAAALLDE